MMSSGPSSEFNVATQMTPARTATTGRTTARRGTRPRYSILATKTNAAAHRRYEPQTTEREPPFALVCGLPLRRVRVQLRLCPFRELARPLSVGKHPRPLRGEPGLLSFRQLLLRRKVVALPCV
jgi:hypothetical protein